MPTSSSSGHVPSFVVMRIYGKERHGKKGECMEEYIEIGMHEGKHTNGEDIKGKEIKRKDTRRKDTRRKS